MKHIMCSPVVHAQSSVKRHGGAIEDYIDIHLFMDESKLHYPFWMHRAITHNSFFIGIVEKVFDSYIKNSEGQFIPVRIICEEHIREDCDNKIPTIREWLEAISEKKQERWMNGPKCEK